MNHIQELKKANLKADLYRLRAFALLIFVIGASFNLTAIKTNECKMPVFIPSATEPWSSDTHFIFMKQTEVNYWFFTDTLKFLNYYYSIGDILMFTGLLLLVSELIIRIGIVIKSYSKEVSYA